MTALAPTMREVKPAWYPKWNGLAKPYQTLYLAYPSANDQLRNAMNRWPQLNILDWAAVTDQVGEHLAFFLARQVGAGRGRRQVELRGVAGVLGHVCFATVSPPMLP